MSDIFISYASEDKSRVQALARALERKGWSVWWDRRIPIGRSFDEVIEEALDASKAVVVVWTTTSVKSQWVKNEAREGLRRRALFPVMLLEEVKLPLEFRDVQTAHLMDWQPDQEYPSFDQFIDDLTGVIGPPVTPLVQPRSVTQSEGLTPTRTRSNPEPETERLSTNMVEVNIAPEQLESKTSALGGRLPPNSESESFMSSGSAVGSEVVQQSVAVDKDRLNETNVQVSSTPPIPIFPIGVVVLAALGALVYFVIFSQGPSSGKRAEVQYQPTVQSSNPQNGVIAPPPAPEPVEKVFKELTSAVQPQEPIVQLRPGSEKMVTSKDGASMVLIPAGEFTMGSRREDKSAEKDEQPAHQVYLDAYYIDQYEVTTAHYAKFIQSTNRSVPKFWPVNAISGHGSKPVVGVDYSDAAAYCSWASKRLPTEAQWEKAARGTDRRLYPWGNVGPSQKVAHFGNTGNIFLNYETLADVGSFDDGKSPYDVYDMAGNVMEWTADWYSENYYSKSPHRNPKGPSSGLVRVIRGGSWDVAPVALRSANRFRTESTNQLENVGFRCTQDVPK